MTIVDNKDSIRVLVYSYYTTITGWGVLLNNIVLKFFVTIVITMIISIIGRTIIATVVARIRLRNKNVEVGGLGFLITKRL